MELIRYLALSGLLFSIGLYGLFVRRSAPAALMSLGVMVSGVTLSAWAFNQYIRPTEMHGYLLAILVVLLSVVYAALSRPLFRREIGSQPASGAADTPERRAPAASQNAADFSELGGLTLSVSLALVCVVGYVLLRVSVEGFLAFILGVGSLKYILLRKYQRRLGHLESARRDEDPLELSRYNAAAPTSGGHTLDQRLS